MLDMKSFLTERTLKRSLHLLFTLNHFVLLPSVTANQAEFLVMGTAQLSHTVHLPASEGADLCAPGSEGFRQGGGGADGAQGRRGDQRKSAKGEGEGRQGGEG